MKKLILGILFVCSSVISTFAYTISKTYTYSENGQVIATMTLRNDGSFIMRWDGQSPISGTYDFKENPYGNDDRGSFQVNTDWGGTEEISGRLIRPRENNNRKLMFDNVVWEAY